MSLLLRSSCLESINTNNVDKEKGNEFHDHVLKFISSEKQVPLKLDALFYLLSLFLLFILLSHYLRLLIFNNSMLW